MTNNNVNNLLISINACYQEFLNQNIFVGPSLYFHQKALAIDIVKDFDSKCETIYALLPSWGMHRMGPKGPKMVDYQIFLESMHNNRDKINHLSKFSPDAVFNIENEHIVHDYFISLQIMDNYRKLVGNSKVFCHLFPNIFGPIDNQYTLPFIERSSIPEGIEAQYAIFKWVHLNIYYPILEDNRFHLFFNRLNICAWDTSKLKVIDNLIIGYINQQL